ncbi:methylated-DNA--[protein]-cysteine S-methyltransferase [Geodermatophilus sabuli]|uniref:methylated-DNA--[protein]-cysteine S-methyltransferase n=1 Tax=Geodermatophilus sabuli TaxID=1564158 RepID=UPI0017E38CBC|nr:methylated-DNA--[protein]-cysteine S-methyltransferase [Geodermatophilus sabuli]MBB3082973.1 methylated-DNA-[protein]-cysteine S-methyltransferase [Geodermatophilus sabuli]
MTRTHTVTGSPIGPLTPVTEDGALVALFMELPGRTPDAAVLGQRDDASSADVVRQLGEYFSGERTAFDLLLRPSGNELQLAVWRLMAEIPYGETRSYGALARQLGDRTLAQAVGAACGRNPLPVVVPCHRVVGADGSLVGFGGGLPRKRFLLDLEQRAQRLF